MIFFYILLGIIGLILLLLFSNIKVKIELDKSLIIKIYYGIFKIPDKLFEKKEKSNDKRKSEKKAKSKSKTKNKSKAKPKFTDKIKEKGYFETFNEVLNALSPVLKILKSFAFKIRINPLIINIKMANDDAAKLAIDYGKFCAVYYPALEVLSKSTKCKNINSNVYVDYLAEKNETYIKTTIKIRLIHCLTHSFCIIKEFLKFKSKFN